MPRIPAKYALIAGAMPFILAGCGAPTAPAAKGSTGSAASALNSNAPGGSIEPNDPKADALLRKSMDMYGGLKSFKTTYTWKIETKPAQANTPQTRTIEYVQPNLFKVVTTTGNESVRCISDGDSIIEYGSTKDPANMIPASSTVARAQSKLLGNPTFAGTMLLSFFSSSDYISDIVDIAKAPITLGSEITAPGGEKAEEVKFYGTGPYGHTTMLIGENTGTVYKVTCDCEPLVQTIKQDGKQKLDNMQITEVYGKPSFNEPIDRSEFAVKAPAGIKVVKQNGVTDKPPFPIGTQAPDFTVTSLKDGKKITLSSLKGKVVILDFWATYCQPCKISMPTNDLIFRSLKGKPFELISVSAEDKAKIVDFDSKTHFAMGLYHDENQSAFKAFKINPIPSMAIIDKDGKLADFFVGVTDASIILSKLRRLGIG